MDDLYFSRVRRDITPLLPPAARRILDVGCGVGATAAWLKTRYPGCTTIGLEGNAALKTELSRNVDEAVIVDLNGELPDVGAADLVLCLDVLEHLQRPLEVLMHVTNHLAEHGTVIVSLPNVAHLSVSLPLLLRARFEYQDSGILDRTHLRFFDRTAVIGLMNEAGLQVRRGVRLGFDGPRARLVDALTLHAFHDNLTKQYVVAGTREWILRQGEVAWLTA